MMTIDNSIKHQARQWSIQLSSEEVDKEMLQAFETWRKQDPKHAQAFIEVDRVWQGISSLEHLRDYAKLPQTSAEQTVTPNSGPGTLQKLKDKLQTLVSGLFSPSGYTLAGAFSFAMVMVMLYLVMPEQSTVEQPAVAQTYAAPHGQIKSVALEDGSQVTLQPQSTLRVEYTASLRKVYLDDGAAMFKVSHNPNKPFVVYTGQTETRVLGTVFTVQRNTTDVAVAVKEGKVQVSKLDQAPGQPQPDNRQVLTAGQGVNADTKGQIGKVTPVDVDTIGSWIEGRLVYNNQKLSAIVADINRFLDKKVLLTSKQMENYELSISFKIAEAEQMLDNLSELLPIVVNKEISGTIVLMEKPEE